MHDEILLEAYKYFIVPLNKCDVITSNCSMGMRCLCAHVKVKFYNVVSPLFIRSLVAFSFMVICFLAFVIFQYW